VSYNTNNIDDRITELLKNGGVGLLPTDTIYGLSTVALNQRAVEKVHRLKERGKGKPLIVLISDISQLSELGLSIKVAGLTERHWPGPVSVIFESTDVPHWLQLGTNSLAIRMPDIKELRRLIEKTGPIVSTSANLQGQKPAKNVSESKKYFKDKLDFYVDFGELEGQPSTLVKIENSSLKIIRQGAYEIPENRMTQITRK
jgi:L-threonylcarbamoyladenylate synthase